MHFSIPDTQEFFNDATSSTYTGYNIYINGSYHCCLRYKQLHSLHEQLRRQLQQEHLNSSGGGISLPPFPPKKLLPLTHGQVELRRAALEQYLQLVGQVPAIAKLELLQTFLLNAQQESAAAAAAEAGREYLLEYCIDVLLMNGYQIQLQCRSNDNASALLNKACQCVNLPANLMSRFCLYLMRKDAKDTLVLLRRLMDFESPVISRQQSIFPCQLVLRKSYWNPAFDLELMQDSIGLNLLFIQTVSDVEREWIIATPEVRKQLRALQERGQKREYMELARQLPLYGCLQFIATSIDYPADVPSLSSALIAIGNKELSMRTFQAAKIQETKFRVTRMRCWRVTAIHNNTTNGGDNGEDKDAFSAPPSNLQLSFEYLLSRQTLRWITITSAQAMLMSVCLQSMVDELLQLKEENTDGQSPTRQQTQTPPLSYVLRNGSGSQTIRAASSSSNELISASSAATQTQSRFFAQRRKINSKTSSYSPPASASSSLSAYASTSPIVFFRNAQESVHNEAFEGIGDDDL